MLDCIVVGGGPAGLSAALLLGRARRRTLVLDAGSPRNHWSRAMHGFLTREGTPPGEFLRLARRELGGYDTVEVRDVEVADAARETEGFSVTLPDGTRETARALLLATGDVDEVPRVEGIEAMYGVSVHHCPYCDGWEHRDAPVAVYGCGGKAKSYALAMTAWSRDLVLLTDGPAGMSDTEHEELAAAGIAVDERPLARLEGNDGRLERIRFADGAALDREAMFFCTGQRQRSVLPVQLGAVINLKGTVETGQGESTPVPGLFVAGDASKDAQLVIVAAAEGAEAAVAINTYLTRLDLVDVKRAAAAVPA